MIGRLLWLLGLLVVIGFFIFLFHPDFISNAGNAFLGSIGRSNAYGSAQLVPNVQGKGNNLQVNLQGLSSNQHYVVALEEGQCGGTVIKSFVGNADSSGNSSILVSLSDLASVAQQRTLGQCASRYPFRLKRRMWTGSNQQATCISGY